MDLLKQSALSSALADQSVLMAIQPLNNQVLAVGERGHILTWTNKQRWQQHQVPVSVSITAVIVLSDGSKVAVGHDGVILKSAVNSEQWQTVFTGHELIRLKIKLLQQQQVRLQQVIDKTEDVNEQDELLYQLEELMFTLDDAKQEQQVGPSQPLLSISRTSQDIIFVTGAYGTLLISIDKGMTWQLISDRIVNPDKLHLNAVISTVKDQIYLVGENGLGFHSANLGKSWSVMSLPYSGSLFGIIATSINGYLVAYGLQGNVMVSLDGGQHWQHKKLSKSASFLGGTVTDDERAILVGHGGLIVDFDIHDFNDIKTHQHPSGAAFSSVLIKDDTLVLAGQFGINFWQIK